MWIDLSIIFTSLPYFLTLQCPLISKYLWTDFQICFEIFKIMKTENICQIQNAILLPHLTWSLFWLVKNMTGTLITRDTERLFLLLLQQVVKSCIQNKQLRNPKSEVRSSSRCDKKWEPAWYSKRHEPSSQSGLYSNELYTLLRCGYYNLPPGTTVRIKWASIYHKTWHVIGV